ncbi:nucleoredoxin-like [Styela clava]|uniref:nucleoredoxin-like n=1 Tax=Styela clava TaxID=7725 RepID=UPI001939ACAF|nr:nucleoredoxin-like [Styela clava]
MPWRYELLGDELVSKGGSITPDSLNLYGEDVLGLYFGAHWCPPCRQFTPKLAQFYNDVNAGGKKFEVVFVSLDTEENSFNGYYNDMPWHAIPFKSDLREKLAGKFYVRELPTLLLLDSRGNLITTKSGVRQMISIDPAGEKFPWKV